MSRGRFTQSKVCKEAFRTQRNVSEKVHRESHPHPGKGFCHLPHPSWSTATRCLLPDRAEQSKGATQWVTTDTKTSMQRQGLWTHGVSTVIGWQTWSSVLTWHEVGTFTSCKRLRNPHSSNLSGLIKVNQERKSASFPEGISFGQLVWTWGEPVNMENYIWTQANLLPWCTGGVLTRVFIIAVKGFARVQKWWHKHPTTAKGSPQAWCRKNNCEANEWLASVKSGLACSLHQNDLRLLRRWLTSASILTICGITSVSKAFTWLFINSGEIWSCDWSIKPNKE